MANDRDGAIVQRVLVPTAHVPARRRRHGAHAPQPAAGVRTRPSARRRRAHAHPPAAGVHKLPSPPQACAHAHQPAAGVHTLPSPPQACTRSPACRRRAHAHPPASMCPAPEGAAAAGGNPASLERHTIKTHKPERQEFRGAARNPTTPHFQCQVNMNHMLFSWGRGHPAAHGRAGDKWPTGGQRGTFLSGQPA